MRYRANGRTKRRTAVDAVELELVVEVLLLLLLIDRSVDSFGCHFRKAWAGVSRRGVSWGVRTLGSAELMYR